MIKTAILLAFLTPFQNEQNEKHLSPQVKSVISRFVRAKGGKSVLENVKNYTIKGEVVSGTDTVGTFEIWQAANRHLSIDHFPDGSSRSHGTDGKIAWRLDVDGKPSILQGQDARDYVRHYASLHESLEWTKQFATILYAGKKQIDNQSVDHLIFVATDNRQINRYFSSKSGLFVREEQIVGTKENTQIMISEIRSYAPDKNGLLVSRSRVNHIGSDYSYEYKITSAATNTLPDDKIFEVPKSVAELRSRNAK